MLDGLLFPAAAVRAVVFSFALIAVIARLAVLRRRTLSELSESDGRPRLSILAFASGLLWLFPFHAIVAVRWASEKLIGAGLLPGPPSGMAVVLAAVCLSLLDVLPNNTIRVL